MCEARSLKVLAFKAIERLERNKKRNTSETKPQNLVSRPFHRETKNCHDFGTFLALPSSHIIDANEERVAISHYDGEQSMTQAKRIAYLDDFVDVLRTLPHQEDQGTHEEDWLKKRIRAAQQWLKENGIQQPK